MSPLLKNMILSAVLLGLFAIVGTLLVASTYQSTRPQIEENQRQAVLHKLHELVPPQQHDNDLYTDVLSVTDPLLGGDDPRHVYRARKNHLPVAAIFSAVAPDGYNGDIELLVAVKMDGSLAGVRVVMHRETPGLGDGIDTRKSAWIRDFDGRSLQNPAEQGWGVKKDGGVFDQFTGATITPRAVVRAVHNTLMYFAQHRDTLFTATANTDEQS